jgi:long-chain acyl-CoA synthetase
METAAQVSLADAIVAVCRTVPDGVAALGAQQDVSQAGSSLTYGEMERRARWLAEELRRLSCQPHEPIVAFVSNAPEDLVTLLGIWLAQAVAVPLYFDTGTETVRAVVERTRARFLILKGQVTAHSAVPEGDELDLGGIRLRITSSEPPPADDLLQSAALVMFTSGSTGKPKGVVLRHSSFLRKLEAIQRVLAFPGGVRSLLVLKLSFAFGQWVTMLTLLQGGTVIMSSRFSVATMIRALLDERVDQVAVVPTMLRSLLNEVHRGQASQLVADLCAAGSPRLICTGGEPLAPAIASEVRALLPHAGLADVYGLTETCTSDFILGPEHFDRYPGSIGFATDGVAFRLRNRETREVARSGEVGELEIDSAHIMAGYLGEPELTRDSFRDGYFATGDLARQGRDGEVYLAGRCKDVIIRGGYKISPLEVDSLLIRHPEVAACLTAGLPDAILGERIHTLVVLREGSAVDSTELRTWLTARLDRYKVPDQIHFGTTIPQGGTGKDDRRELQKFLRTTLNLS